MVDLKAVPYGLDDQACRWVMETLQDLSEREKVGQLFCEILWDAADTLPDEGLRDMAPGAVMYRPFAGARMNEVSWILQSRSKVPLLIAANLERGGSGGNGGLTDGTYFASPMGVAATNNPLHAYRSGLVAASEAAAAGINWTFGPIADIDVNPENPITNVRTYGSDVERVISMAKGYMDGFAESGMGVAIKHFPGDGIDFRDQHLLASINSLSSEEWWASFGKIYRALIDHGAQAVMSAHIKQPALTREITPDITDEKIMPASLSPELNVGVLRGALGFNGVIVTDATLMAGFTSAMERRAAVPAAIASGCDMFLFTINQEEDFQYMLDGVVDGTISRERLDEAVARILAMKASLGLHVKQAEGTLVPPLESLQVLQSEPHTRWARECADHSVTLVKDRQGIFPITPGKFKKIVLIPVINADCASGYPAEIEQFKQQLEDAGHEVSYFRSLERPGELLPLSEHRKNTDLVIYVADMNVRSNQTSIRITWTEPRAADSAMYVTEVPTVFISFSNPYHLVDVPMMRTYINAYTLNPPTVDAVIEKIIGRSSFTGVSPVDPFAGLWDTRL